MSNSVFPPQIGFIPSGTNNQKSQLVLGRNITGAYEGIGIGAGGRPDGLESIVVYISNGLTTATPSLPLTINIDTVALLQVIAANPINAPSVFGFTLQEVSTCETDANGISTEKRRMALLSQAYLPAAS